jgi:hypothetical protein
MLRGIVRLAALAAALASPGAAAAQDSRTALLEKLREEKAAALRPYQPGTIERALLFVERADPMRKIAPHNGFFVQYGYTGKPVGSGIAASVGYRHDLFDRRARITVETGATWRHYRMVRADFSVPSLAHGKVELGLEGIDHHQPEEDFYGLGAASLDSNRVSFLFDRREVQGRAVVKPGGGVRIGIRSGRIAASVGGGQDPRFPSIEERFSDADAPGLARQPDFLYGELFALLDRRDQPGNPRAGGYYGVTWRRYSDHDFDRYGFRAFLADLQHFFPIFDKKRVIALRGRIVTTGAETGQIVPFYFRPTLGGSDSLRSARDFRFRDSNMMAVNAEYRWEAFSGLDMALFADLGKVAPRAADLDFSDLEQAFGVGFRFNTYRTVFLRLDVALAGADKPRMFIKFSKAF